MQTPTSGVAPDDEDVAPLLDEDELLQPLLLVVEPLDDEVPHPSPTHGTPRMPTSPPATRATQTRPGLHLCSALHS
jgi:hypothetical protein